jgi:hypothetical protein
MTQLDNSYSDSGDDERAGERDWQLIHGDVLCTDQIVAASESPTKIKTGSASPRNQAPHASESSTKMKIEAASLDQTPQHRHATWSAESLDQTYVSNSRSDKKRALDGPELAQRSNVTNDIRVLRVVHQMLLIVVVASCGLFLMRHALNPTHMFAQPPAQMSKLGQQPATANADRAKLMEAKLDTLRQKLLSHERDTSQKMASILSSLSNLGKGQTLMESRILQELERREATSRENLKKTAMAHVRQGEEQQQHLDETDAHLEEMKRQLHEAQEVMKGQLQEMRTKLSLKGGDRQGNDLRSQLLLVRKELGEDHNRHWQEHQDLLMAQQMQEHEYLLLAQRQQEHQDLLDAQIVAEAIAESRGARDEPGVREEWERMAKDKKRGGKKNKKETVEAASCYEARPDDFPSCQGYQECGYHCVGGYCASSSPLCDFSFCANAVEGGTIDHATGRCVGGGDQTLGSGHENYQATTEHTQESCTRDGGREGEEAEWSPGCGCSGSRHTLECRGSQHQLDSFGTNGFTHKQDRAREMTGKTEQLQGPKSHRDASKAAKQAKRHTKEQIKVHKQKKQRAKQAEKAKQRAKKHEQKQAAARAKKQRHQERHYCTGRHMPR